MTFSEAFIIYSSLGAPVAVYYYQHQRKLQDRNIAIQTLTAFLLWPAALAKIIINNSAIRPVNEFDESANSDVSDELLQEIFELAKRELNQNGRGGEVAEFREMIERYAGLSSASRSRHLQLKTAVEFFAAAGHPKPELAAACRTRHAAEKLQAHSEAAAAELLQFFSRFNASSELTTFVHALTATFGDHDIVRPSSYSDSSIDIPFPARAA